MKKIFLFCLTVFILSGCVSKYAVLENTQTGERKFCKSEGWGWLGAPVALSQHQECINKLKEKGYQVEGE